MFILQPITTRNWFNSVGIKSISTEMSVENNFVDINLNFNGISSKTLKPLDTNFFASINSIFDRT